MRIIAESNNYYIDKNNNKWSKDTYILEQAEKLSETLNNCRDCVDCKYCDNCNGCKNCNLCIDCNCCINCDRCVECFACMRCETCFNCENCKDCNFCEKCKGHEYRVMLKGEINND